MRGMGERKRDDECAAPGKRVFRSKCRGRSVLGKPKPRLFPLARLSGGKKWMSWKFSDPFFRRERENIVFVGKTNFTRSVKINLVNLKLVVDTLLLYEKIMKTDKIVVKNSESEWIVQENDGSGRIQSGISFCENFVKMKKRSFC
jgi:hypothetical protein